jgi:hypothetical protein
MEMKSRAIAAKRSAWASVAGALWESAHSRRILPPDDSESVARILRHPFVEA